MTTSPPSLTSSEASSSTAPAAVSGIHQKNGWNLDAPAFTPVLSFPTLAYADQHHYDVGPSRRGGYGRNRFRGGLSNENQRSHHHKWKGSFSAQEYGGAHHQEANSTYRQRVLRRGESDEPHMQDALDPPSFHSQISPHLSDADHERSDVHSLAESLAASTIFTDEESSASYVESLRTQSSMESGRPWNRGGNDGSKPGLIRTQTTVNSEERRLEQRQKQIDFGKNTLGYQRYIEAIPRHKRKRTDPQTPNKYSKCSKRCWDGLIRHWRRKLHEWDPPELKDQAHRDDELYEANDSNANTEGPSENMKRSTVSRNLFPSAGMPSDGSSTSEATLLSSQTSGRWKGDLDDDVISELDQKYARRLRPLETFEGFGSKSSKRDTESYWPAADVTTGTLDNKFGHRFLLSESVELGGFQ
ncbi:hypothetical protein HDU85_005443 [Gaertneriomyces sp. JEL0708]|nr:hypothetical protein HDU85_005443 [Gaertneriomyces sp. JEL0708]